MGADARQSEHLSPARLVAYALGVAAIGSVGWRIVSTWGQPDGASAVVTAGLLIVWVGLVGGALTAWRYPVARALGGLAAPWQATFLGATLALLAAEVGLGVGLAAIVPLLVPAPDGLAVAWATRATLDAGLVAAHLVVWTLLLSRWAYAPVLVALLIGLGGALAQVGLHGADALILVPAWTLVYATCAWVPARAIPGQRGAEGVETSHLWVGVLLPPLAVLPIWGVLRLVAPDWLSGSLGV